MDNIIDTPAPTDSAPSQVAPVNDGVQTPSSSGQAAPAAAASAEPKIDVAGNRSALSGFLAPINDPEPPKEYNADGFRKYQDQQAQVARFRTVQQDMINVAQGITEIAPGYSHHFSSPDEVRKYGEFAARKAGGDLTPKDLLVLHNINKIIKDAEDRGARQYEAKLKATKPAQQQQAAQQQRPANQPQPAQADRPLTIREILQRDNPDEYRRLTTP
jgi:hypothetical protein